MICLILHQFNIYVLLIFGKKLMMIKISEKLWHFNHKRADIFGFQILDLFFSLFSLLKSEFRDNECPPAEKPTWLSELREIHYRNMGCQIRR